MAAMCEKVGEAVRPAGLSEFRVSLRVTGHVWILAVLKSLAPSLHI